MSRYLYKKLFFAYKKNNKLKLKITFVVETSRAEIRNPEVPWFCLVTIGKFFLLALLGLF